MSHLLALHDSLIYTYMYALECNSCSKSDQFRPKGKFIIAAMTCDMH